MSLLKPVTPRDAVSTVSWEDTEVKEVTAIHLSGVYGSACFREKEDVGGIRGVVVRPEAETEAAVLPTQVYRGALSDRDTSVLRCRGKSAEMF